MNIIVSFKGVSDVSVVLLQNAYEIMSPFADTSCCMTFHYTSLRIKPPTGKVCCSDGVQNHHGRPLVSNIFQYNAAVYFILQFVQTNSAEHLMLNSP